VPALTLPSWFRLKVHRRDPFEVSMSFAEPTRAPRPTHPPLSRQPSGAERRVHRRVCAEVDITWHSGHNFFATRTRDISAGGLFLETREALTLGQHVSVEITLLKRTFWLRAEVAWVLDAEAGKVGGAGLRFLEIDDAARRTIAVFMSLRDPLRVDVDVD
jgi:uncharacterized protein (TIGR02266 family)